jgi:hypothetical protein
MSGASAFPYDVGFCFAVSAGIVFFKDAWKLDRASAFFT